jgi:hypothetical protein
LPRTGRQAAGRFEFEFKASGEHLGRVPKAACPVIQFVVHPDVVIAKLHNRTQTTSR